MQNKETGAAADLGNYDQSMAVIHPAPTEFTADEIAADPILQFFHYTHLPAALQQTSRPFCDVAYFLIHTLPRTAERSTALRKLLEAKDCAVRANVAVLASEETFLDRLKKERNELADRRLKLLAFLDGEQAGASPVQVALLYDQADAMATYLDVLDSRLADLDNDVRTTARREPEAGEIQTIGEEHSEPPKFRD